METKEIKVEVFNIKLINHDEFFSLKKSVREKMFINQLGFRAISGGLSTAVKTLITWCNENCQSVFYVSENHIFYFHEESDATAFKLRWS